MLYHRALVEQYLALRHSRRVVISYLERRAPSIYCVSRQSFFGPNLRLLLETLSIAQTHEHPCPSKE